MTHSCTHGEPTFDRSPILAVWPDGSVTTSPNEVMPPLTDCAADRLVDAITKLLASYVRGGRAIT